jgi:hypothetical protein
MGSTLSPNSFGIDGISIRISYEDAIDAMDNHACIEASPLVDDKDVYPLTAMGDFDSDGNWLFFKTNSYSGEFELEYDEFIDALYETAPN